MNNYFSIGELDYISAQELLKINLVNYNTVAVHCQQACEKYLKHLVVLHNIEPQYISTYGESKMILASHNLVSIMHFLEDNGVSINVSKRHLDFLSKFYFKARYPGDQFIEVDSKTAGQCIVYTENVREEVLKNINL